MRATILTAAVLFSLPALAESGPINFHLEGGATVPMSTPDFIGVGFNGAAKIDVPVAGPAALQAQGMTSTLPRTVRQNNLYGVGLGVRVRILDDHQGYKFHTRGDTRGGNWFGNLWFDGSILLTGTSALNRLGVDVGVGTELSLIEGLQAGPFLKFTNADAISLVTGGISLSLGGPDAALAPADADHDGIVDEQDKCVTQPEDKDGYKDDDGCPDPDNDGDNLIDDRDKCPNAAEDVDGFEDADGCPDLDNDKDGIADAADKCASEPEDKDNFQDEDGCPEPDNDQDGILDAADSCPSEAEDKDNFQDEDGCPDPDNDQDGVLDANDKCPMEPETVNGVEDEDGCPEQTRVFIKKDQIVITEKVFFATNKTTIQPQSFDLLTNVAEVLKKFPAIKKLRVDGHTDDVGNDAFNQKLSEGRAQAVVDFLVSKGVEKERLEPKGFGKTQPVDTAKTPEAREKNRRVEFVITDPEGGLVETRTEVKPGEKAPDNAVPTE